MPGPEDYSYPVEEGARPFEPLGPEVTQADSNPAYSLARDLSEQQRTEEQQAEVELYENSAGKNKDVVDGEGNVILTQEEIDAVNNREAGKGGVTNVGVAAPVDAPQSHDSAEDKDGPAEDSTVEQPPVKSEDSADEAKDEAPAEGATPKAVPKSKRS